MDHMDGHAPDLNVAAAMQFQCRVLGIGGFQPQSTAVASQTLQREGPVEHGDHHAAWPWVEAAVHHQQIAVMNAGTDHGIAAHAQKERAGGVADELVIQVNPHLHVVIGGGRKTCRNPLTSQRQEPLRSPRLQRQQWIALPVLHTPFLTSTSEL